MGLKSPKKIKTMEKKLKMEKPTVIFLQDTKCKSKTFDRTEDLESM